MHNLLFCSVLYSDILPNIRLFSDSIFMTKIKILLRQTFEVFSIYKLILLQLKILEIKVSILNEQT